MSAAPETVLQEAARIIDGQRTDDYGDPEDSFQLIADYWNTYLSEVLDVTDTKLGPADVAHMMALLKLARVTTGHSTRDSYVDLAGYAALAARIQGLDEVPIESLPAGGDSVKSGTSRIPEHVREVVVAGRRYIRSVVYDGQWMIAGVPHEDRYWIEGDIYQYATEQNAEVEY